mgnify:CR=1 FL=1
MAFSILLRIVGGETLLPSLTSDSLRTLSVSSCGSWGVKPCFALCDKRPFWTSFSILLRIVGGETIVLEAAKGHPKRFQYPLADRGG